MEPNHTGNGDGESELSFLDDDEFFKEWEKLESPHASSDPISTQHHQRFPPSDEKSNTHTFNYPHDQSNYAHAQYQPSHQPPSSSYYHNYMNPPSPSTHYDYHSQQSYHPHSSYLSTQNPVPHQYQPHPFPSQPPPQAYHHPHFSNSQPPCLPQQTRYSHGYNTPSQFGDVSPMQRMQQLATQQHGGPLAQSAAAAAAAEAQSAARRISPDGKRRRQTDGEETVRDVLHRQYVEQRRQQEMAQMQQMQPMQYQPGFPNLYSKSVYQPYHSAPSHPSMDAPSPSASHLDSPSAPPTPIFTFPLVTANTSPPPPVVSQPSPSSSGKDVPPPNETFVEEVKTVEPLGALDTDAQKAALIDRLKTARVMSELQKANRTAMERDSTVERMSGAALHQAANVVRNLEATSSSSRKRPIDATSSARETIELPLKPGPRIVINDKGEQEQKVYMLVRYCNQNDPEYNPTGVLKTMDQIKEEKERGDMISFSYTTHVIPYEMVDFRIKKPAGYENQKEAAASKDATSTF